MHKVHTPTLVDLILSGTASGMGVARLMRAARFDSKVQFKLIVDAIHALMIVGQSHHITQG